MSFISIQKDRIKNIKYNVYAYIQRACINKNIQFQSKVVWKRSNQKAQTKQVHHNKGFSIFNQTIVLPLNMPYNQKTQKYDQKNTQISVLITLNGVQKSGGVAKYNISQIFNNNQENVKKLIPLTKCPDPKAFLQITFTKLQKIQGLQDNSQLSILNPLQNDLSLSRIQFNDDKTSLQIQRINQTIKKIEELTISTDIKINNKRKSSQKQILNPNNNLKELQQNKQKLKNITQQYQTIQKQKTSLKNKILILQQSLSKKTNEYKQQKQKYEDKIQDLQYQINRRQKQQSKKNRSTKDQSQNQQKKFKQLYQKSLIQIQQLKYKIDSNNNNNDRKSIDFNKLMINTNLQQQMRLSTGGDISNNFNHHQKNHYNQHQHENSSQQLQLKDLKNVNNQLQNQLAQMSYKLAQVFNASYQYGGAKLLDYLQTQIGLTQFNNQ